MLDQIIILTASAFVSLMVVDFTLGLLKLWHSTTPETSQPQIFDNAQKQPQKPALQEPKTEFDTDVWFEALEVSQPQPQPVKPLAAPFYQLCLPPASAVNTPAKEKITETAKIDLLSYTIRQLKNLAKERGLKAYSRFTKAELAQALS